MSAPATSRLHHVRFAGVPPDTAQQPSDSSAIVAHPPADAGTSGDEIAPPDGFPAWLLARAGLDPADYRAEPLERRVPACLRALKADSEAAAQHRVEAEPGLLHTALDVLLIGVTDFFRDTDVFDALQRHVFPDLAGREQPLRVWSVGCSTGAELYSVAILLAEAGLLARASLVGTDCRLSAIDAARVALYPETSLACVPLELRHRYFTHAGDRRQLACGIRDRVEWYVRDVLFRAESGPWDLVLCRNVAIYLAPSAARRLTDTAAATLAPGGFIVVGRAERLPADAGLVQVARCVYRRQP